MDTTTTPGTETAQAAPVADAVVNGPSDDALDWQSVDWRQAEDSVRRLRQRIFTASQEGDLKRVRNLQKLMLRSRANALLSVRRVTEANAGRIRTISPTPHAKSLTDAVRRLQQQGFVDHTAEGRRSAYQLTPEGELLLPLVIDFAENVQRCTELHPDPHEVRRDQSPGSPVRPR